MPKKDQKPQRRGGSDLRPHKAPEPINPDLPPPFKGPPISDPSLASSLPDLDTAEAFDYFTKYMAKQRHRLQNLGLLPEAKMPPFFPEPPVCDPSLTSELPELETAEQFVLIENYVEAQRRKLAKQKVIPVLPEGVKVEDVMAFGKKVVDFCEKWIDKIEISLSLRKIE